MATCRVSNALLAQLRSLTISSSSQTRQYAARHCRISCISQIPQVRSFSSTSRSQNWLLPSSGVRKKTHKGRPQVNTGGSSRGTKLAYGDYGLRLKSLGGRLPSKNLSIAVEAIKRRMRGAKYTLYPRIVANVPVFTKGNEQRMGKGKGGFDYWCARVAHGRVILEIGGDVHEQVVMEALRLASNKLPGQWELLRKSDREVVGSTRLKGEMTKAELFVPKRTTALHPLHLMPDGRRAGEIADAEQQKLDASLQAFEEANATRSVAPTRLA